MGEALRVKTAYRWYRQTLHNPQYRWWLILGSLLYLISPLDLSPDVIPLLGQIDDLVLLTILFTEVSQLITDALRPRPLEPLRRDDDPRAINTVDVDAVTVQDD
ncbi:DUF1232 domain-containing protein [Spirulina subsalsa FACHB-351]|uniref:DUF1232 domain-containing protein n=1 Tax=Spirulina subsalsa FACHB-351 TaxID=234711 RepID=A0ABT3L0K4_9CYAN|nr:YkvA family protein [Spirulina subsalsa]MCW6035010.1 DUF1232 domain-containing protein [Spirulina subsalsa FACHB-351]